jgi:hypothetical protein
VEEVPKWVEFVNSVVQGVDEQQENAGIDVESIRGSVMLVQYLLLAWQTDLDARVEVCISLCAVWGLCLL